VWDLRRAPAHVLAGPLANEASREPTTRAA
jgi:hypothetical protein